ncbi:leucyl/phenylalanyl-tRNA--protein transferase [Streptomyces niveus]|uniref:leucyl/phenylalanyl-tRNA--protein transferase n=1 Tax=Streptomyces niveus TaxID=193462 RepID=UPI0033E71E77
MPDTVTGGPVTATPGPDTDGSSWRDTRPGPGGQVPVAVGGELSGATLLDAYRLGVFCQPTEDPEQIMVNREIYAPDVASGEIPTLPGGADPYGVLWWSPSQRSLLPVDGFRLGRRGAKHHRQNPGVVSTFDTAFDEVVERCREGRETLWLTDPLVSGLRSLHREGAVHSLEIRAGGKLVAGLVGYAFPRVFVVDTAFQCEPHCLKALYLDLALRAREAGIEFIDLQVDAEHKRRLGATLHERDLYLGLLAGDRKAETALNAAPRSLARNLREYSATTEDKS